MGSAHTALAYAPQSDAAPMGDEAEVVAVDSAGRSKIDTVLTKIWEPTRRFVSRGVEPIRLSEIDLGRSSFAKEGE
jgi:hypothetical protein